MSVGASTFVQQPHGPGLALRLTVVGVGFIALACSHTPGSRPTAGPPSAFAVADSLRREGRASQGLSLYVALRDSFAHAHDTADWWRAALWSGYEFVELSQRDSARRAIELASQLALGDSSREGWTVYVRSNYFDRQGIFDSALMDAARAQTLARSSGDRLLEASARHAMGRIHSLTGHYREALADNTAALALERATLGDTARAAVVELNELGIDYRHLGRFTDAEHALQRALSLERERHNPEGVARVSSNLANVYVATGDDSRALPLMIAALRGAEQTGNVRGQVYEHSDLADLFARSGNRDSARAHLDAALALNRNGFLAYGRVQSLDALGDLDLADRQPREAAVVLDSARRLADAEGFGLERVTSRVGLARAQTALGDGQSAVRWASASVEIADSLGDPAAEADAREARAAALEATGRTGALDEYRAAIALIESWRGRVALGDLRMGVAEPRLAAYEGAIRMLVQQGKGADAFDVAEHARARLLLDLIAEHEAGEPHSRREELQQRLRERFAARDDVPPGERPAVDREIGALIDSVGEADRDEQEHDPASAIRVPTPAPFGRIQHDLVGPGRALLAYFWGDSAVYGWWITASSVHAVRLGRADSLATVIQFLRGAIDDPSAAVPWQPSARRAYEQLVEPLAPDTAPEVLVVADGPLAYVPFEVLLPAAGTAPWGATHRFVYGPSAGVLRNLATTTATPDWARAMLAVGDPETESSVKAARADASADGSLPPLPYSAAEARDIASLFVANGADVLIGRAATVSRWQSLQPARYRYLHFAAHAEVSDRQPETSALLLGGSPLDLPAIRRLNLTAQLVTLSACETGLGRRVRGEGMLGLPHAFLAAGARGVVVTLWRVTDRSAADFMRDFYGQVRNGLSPAAALQAVRRARIAGSGQAAHPSRWAPFVLVGGLAR